MKADWQAAVAAAAAESDGFRPVRGFKRLHIRLFGADVAPPVSVYRAALDYKLDEIETAVESAAVDARLTLHGLGVSIERGRAGRALDRAAAERLVVRALADLSPVDTVALPVVSVAPEVTPPALVAARRQARTALSASVRLTDGTTTWRLPRARIAELLRLPVTGGSDVTVGGPGAAAWVARITKTVDRPRRTHGSRSRLRGR